MSVVATAPYSTATGNGVTTSFPFAFACQNVANVAVYVNGVQQFSGFTVTVGADGNSGTVVFATAPAIGAAIIFASAPSFAQPIAFENAGPYNPSVVDDAIDAAAIRGIYLAGLIARSALVPLGETMGAYPSKTVRAGQYMAFDANGNPVAAGGTGGGDLNLRTDLAASSGSSLSGFIQPGTGAVARTVQSKLQEVVSAEDFGAVGDGVTDDTTAITNAQAAVGAGGAVMLKRGKIYAISATLVLSANGASLIGAGSGDLHDTGSAYSAPTVIRWIGASGGTMVQVKSTTTQFIAGNVFRGIFLDSNSLAAVGLNLVGSRQGTYEVVGDHFTTALLKMDPDPSLSEPAGCSENRIVKLTGYQTNVGDGAILLQTSTSSWNCSQNKFDLISGDFRNNYAIDIQGSDSETFEVVKLYSTNSAIGVRLKAGATALQATRNNMFHYLNVTPAPTTTCVPALAEGTADGTYPSIENNILFLDTANNHTMPTVHTGASLWWGSIEAPLGMRSSTMASGSQNIQYASGRIKQSGISGSIAANANATVTFATAFPTAITKISVTPASAATSFYAAPSGLTGLTIYNATGGAASTFYWEAEGY